MLNRLQIIEQIRQINPSADQSWLEDFQDASLRHYLDHLQITTEPRGGESFWIRMGETAAAVTRRPAA